MPDPIGVHLYGHGSGPNGSSPTATPARSAAAGVSSRRSSRPPPPRSPNGSGTAPGPSAASRAPDEILDHFEISDGTLRTRRPEFESLGIAYRKGRGAVYYDPATAEPAALRVDIAAGQEQLKRNPARNPQNPQPQPCGFQKVLICRLANPQSPTPYGSQEPTSRVWPTVDED